MTRVTFMKVFATMTAMSCMCLANDCANGSCENDDVSLLALPQKYKKNVALEAMKRSKRSASKDPASDLTAAINTKAPIMDDTGFSLLVGDADGIKFAFKTSEPYCDNGLSTYKNDFASPFRVASTGKWVTATAIGAAVQAGKFAWDDPINKYVDFWATSASDTRSKVTFRNLMSMESGLVASAQFGTPGIEAHMWGDLDNTVETHDVGWGNTDFTLEDVVRQVFDGTKSNVAVGNTQVRYGETHFLVAQYAAIKATGEANWQSFMETYWGNKLGLNRQNNKMSYEGDALSYGFVDDFPWKPNGSALKKDELVPNPDGGSQLVTTGCSMSRWLTEWLKNPNTYGSQEMDTVPAGQKQSFHDGAQYALGHWVQVCEGMMDLGPPGPAIHHSMGAYGAFPMHALDDNGKPFWAYLHRYWKSAPGASYYSRLFVGLILPDLRTYMASGPAADTTTCPQ